MKVAHLQISQNGRISIPKEMRQELGLVDGDAVMVSVEGKRLILESEAALLDRLYTAVGQPPEGKLVSNRLLAERREEAKREDIES